MLREAASWDSGGPRQPLQPRVGDGRLPRDQSAIAGVATIQGLGIADAVQGLTEHVREDG